MWEVWNTVCVYVLVTQLYLTLCNPMDYMWPTRLLCPWNSSGKNTWVGCHFLLLGIFPTQGLNLVLLHCRQIFFFFFFLPSEPKGKPCMEHYSSKNAICSNIDRSRNYHTKWSKSENDKMPYDIYLLTGGSKIWHKWTYLWNRNGLTDIESTLVVVKGEGWIGSLELANGNYDIQNG